MFQKHLLLDNIALNVIFPPLPFLLLGLHPPKDISLFRHQCYKWRMSPNIWNMAVDQWESLCCHHLSGIVYNSVPVPHWDSSPCFMAPYWRSEKNLSSARLPLCSVNQPTSRDFSCLLCCIVFINELAWSWWCCTVIWFDMQAHW